MNENKAESTQGGVACYVERRVAILGPGERTMEDISNEGLHLTQKQEQDRRNRTTSQSRNRRCCVKKSRQKAWRRGQPI